MAHNIKLKSGLAIGSFADYVDTFNFLVDFCNNLKGEGDEAEGGEDSGAVKVDRTNEDHPVIRGGGGVACDEADGDKPLVTAVEYDSSSGSLRKRSRSATVQSGKIVSVGSESATTDVMTTSEWADMLQKLLGVASGSFSVVTGVKYDTSDHCLKVQTQTITVANGLITDIGNVGSWTTIDGGQAEPLYVS